MFFESVNIPFSSVASMAVGWYKVILHVVKKFFKAADASLSKVWSLGLKPLDVSSW
jgi:hypothetical protein